MLFGFANDQLLRWAFRSIVFKDIRCLRNSVLRNGNWCAGCVAVVGLAEGNMGLGFESPSYYFFLHVGVPVVLYLVRPSGQKPCNKRPSAQFLRTVNIKVQFRIKLAIWRKLKPLVGVYFKYQRLWKRKLNEQTELNNGHLLSKENIKAQRLFF